MYKQARLNTANQKSLALPFARAHVMQLLETREKPNAMLACRLSRDTTKTKTSTRTRTRQCLSRQVQPPGASQDWNTRRPKNIIRAQRRSSVDGRLPKLRLDPAFASLGDGAPVGRRLGFEPVEVVDLVPLVGRWVLAVGQLLEAAIVSTSKIENKQQNDMVARIQESDEDEGDSHNHAGSRQTAPPCTLR